MTQYSDLFAALAAPFHPEELKVRSQAGRQFYYMTARTVMNRLDNVLGPENWYDSYEPGEHSVLCKLTIRLPDGSMLTKQDAGGYAGMADSGDDEKSGYSDGFKRAAVKFGIGRYLYRDGVPAFAQDQDLPASAAAAAPAASPSARPHAAAANGNPPRTGRALFAWTKEQEQRHEVGLLKYLSSWAKLQEFPGRMVDWDADQVGRAHSEACRKLSSLQPGHSEAYEQAIAN
jgi:hypothetical protein